MWVQKDSLWSFALAVHPFPVGNENPVGVDWSTSICCRFLRVLIRLCSPTTPAVPPRRTQYWEVWPHSGSIIGKKFVLRKDGEAVEPLNSPRSCRGRELNYWLLVIDDHEVVEPFNSPRWNLGMNVNEEEDDNPEWGWTFRESDTCSPPFGVVGLLWFHRFPRVAPAVPPRRTQYWEVWPLSGSENYFR